VTENGEQGRAGRALGYTVVPSFVLGALVLAAVFATAGDLESWAWGAALAVVPVGPVAAAYLWLDRYEPEPRGLLVLTFVWGAVVATSVALVLQALDQVAFARVESMSAVIAAPATEEAAKGAFLIILLWLRRHEIDGVLDGVVYAGMVGLGFAFTENILYLGSAFAGDEGMGPGGWGSAVAVFVLRGVMSPFAHPLFTSAIGIGAGLAVTRRHSLRWVWPLVGYAVAVVLHAAWNLSAYYGQGRYFFAMYLLLMVPAFASAVGLAIWARRSEGRMLTTALLDAARQGLIRAEEVPWVTKLGARRAARNYAASIGGPQGRRAMAAFQQQAIELGFLHGRYLRGIPPSDLDSRGWAIVQRMQALRPYAHFPMTTTPSLVGERAAPDPERRGGA
jgi:RsiW-degrading membrane proteinase PrsW (M82 family)